MLFLSESDRVTSALVLLALDAAAMRHQATANNLANIHSTGYQAQRVNFEEQLSALRHAVEARAPVEPAAVDQVRPFIEYDATRAIDSIAGMIDMEVVKLSQNAVHYQSLLKALDKRGSILALAVNEGRT
jgi:flagellar basal-body rod protein FlgB